MVPQLLIQLVSLVRNFLCVCKSLLPEDHWARDVLMKAPFSGEDVLIIEAIIGVLQFAGGVFLTIGGIQKMLSARKEVSAAESMERVLHEDGTTWMEYILLQEALEKRKKASRQSFNEGLHELSIGVGFYFLAAFSFHNCGLFPLMVSLAVVEVSLFVLLWYGIKGIFAALQRSRIVKMAYGKERKQLPSKINPDNVDWVSLKLHREEDLQVDFDKTVTQPDNLRGQIKKMKKTITEIDEVLENKKGIRVTKEMEEDRIQKLVETDEKIAEAIFGLWIIFLNIIAGVGYALLPLTHFYPDEGSFAYYLYDMWPGHEFAAWWGNFAGDVAWTIEPLSLIFAPVILGMILRFTKDQAISQMKKEN
mmetsp:Transcript_24689/g.32220  ORF Transcript_24689/g.32220 Transcript_24689/m.32220 type:complete len:363 (-) Transcript_24689:180-1268(-)|eukprot:CAMPEP_0117752544 /NCGR_PEP_ID=MMETSP0947-20121206/11668_1 /TAXON_ID=44440 /ORGANISM="Chattonella subsalsa, Strain CCMP2191" /LENGTH=362 /DNA_ID=CAMNT_0005571205 /DNA_START=122 /DNA_END=1210 /DNA_ORIENTATION=+